MANEKEAAGALNPLAKENEAKADGATFDVAAGFAAAVDKVPATVARDDLQPAQLASASGLLFRQQSHFQPLLVGDEAEAAMAAGAEATVISGAPELIPTKAAIAGGAGVADETKAGTISADAGAAAGADSAGPGKLSGTATPPERFTLIMSRFLITSAEAAFHVPVPG